MAGVFCKALILWGWGRGVCRRKLRCVAHPSTSLRMSCMAWRTGSRVNRLLRSLCPG